MRIIFDKPAKAGRLALVSVLLTALSAPVCADPYQNVSIGLSGFVYNGKKLKDAYAAELADINNKGPSQWLERIEALGQVSRGDYWRAIPHIQTVFRKALFDRCAHYKYGKQASDEAYEICFATELRRESLIARTSAKSGLTDLGQITAASPALGAEIARRCGDSAPTAICVNETLQSQATSLGKASGQIEHAIGAWTIASNLRAACDARFATQAGAQPCSGSRSVSAWRALFRPPGNGPPEGLPSPVPPAPGCKPRSELLEDTVAGCLNDGCGKATGNEASAGCQLLANPVFSPFASSRVKGTMTYLDADSLVFLTRASVVSRLLAANYQATGTTLDAAKVPPECKANSELYAGIQHWPKPPLTHPKGELTASAQTLTKVAKGLVKMQDQGFDEYMENELAGYPALLPLDATGDFQHDLSLARSVASFSAKGKPERALALLLGTADAKTTEALRQVCKADWIALVNMPLARRAALEIGGTLSRPDAQEGCKAANEYPADMQAKQGKCMPWLLRCMFSQVTTEQKREMMGQMCAAASMGVALVAPPAGFAAGAFCAGLTTANHVVARMDEADARKIAVVCTGLPAAECSAKEIIELTKAMQHEIVAAGFDIAIQLGAPIAAGKVLGLAGRGIAVTLPRARAILAELRALHAGLAAEEKTAGTAEGEALAAKIEALFNDTDGIVPTPANAKPRLELVIEDDAVVVPQQEALFYLPKPAKPVVFDIPDTEAATVAYPKGYPTGDPDPTRVFAQATAREPVTVTYESRPTVSYPKGDPEIAKIFHAASGPRGPPSVVDLNAIEDISEHAVLLEEAPKPAIKLPPRPPRIAKPQPIVDVTEHAVLLDELPDVTEHAVELAASPHVSLPAVEVPSAVPGRPTVVAVATNYATGGRTVEQLARDAAGVTADTPLEPLGVGGMNRVWTNPADPSSVVKVLDRDLIWKEMRQGLVGMAEEAKNSGKFELQKVIEDSIARYDHSIPAGGTVPPAVDETIAKAIQRHRVLGKTLREEILPALQSKMKADGIKVTMRVGLEDISDTGACKLTKVNLGEVDANGQSMVEAKDYLRNLSHDDPVFKKILKIRDKWNASLRPYNLQAVKTNSALGLEFQKAGAAVGYDLGNKGDKFGNVFLRVDKHGKVLEIMIADY